MRAQSYYLEEFQFRTETEIKNGRATVELFLSDLSDKNADGYRICLWDAKEEMVFYALHPAGEEDPCILQLQHPHLWETGNDPYLYRLEIYGAGREPLVCMPFPVRELTQVSEGVSLLNGRPFTPKPVFCENVCDLGDKEEALLAQRIDSRLVQLARMGANMLFVGGIARADREFLMLQNCCDRSGLLLETDDGSSGDGIFADRIFGKTLFLSNGRPSASYYLQRARWSSCPFVYIHAGSLQRQSDGLYRINVYSNQQRVALFVNGVVFGFLSDGPEFVFQDIPAKHFPLLLSAEAGGSSMSVTCYR